MRLRMKQGDYIPDNLGDFQKTTEHDRVLAAALFLLTARRGKFAPRPEVGSRLYLITREKPSQWESTAVLYAQEALESLGITVEKAVVTPAPEGLRVEIHGEYKGEMMGLEATVI